jgi:hypothetical protein
MEAQMEDTDDRLDVEQEEVARLRLLAGIQRTGKTPEEADRILAAAIDEAFASIRSAVPDFDGAGFRNALRDADAFPEEYNQYEEACHHRLLMGERRKRRRIADRRIVMQKLGGSLEREIGGRLVTFVEERDEHGRWSGTIMYGPGTKVSKEQLAQLAGLKPEDPKQRAVRDDLLAFASEGQARLEKLDPKAKARRAREYLNVPYARKDMAKALGAKWDPGKRKWYAPTPEIAAKLEQFRTGGK